MSLEDPRLLHASAVQIVCQNLSHSWREAFLSHLRANGDKMTEEDLWSFSTFKGTGVDGTDTPVDPNRSHESMIPSDRINTCLLSEESVTKQSQSATAGNSVAKVKPMTQSQGLKQLAKVNTRGMKKMDLFFQKSKDKK
jgi:hypothetical protein